jgi:hypothetical protein
MRGKLLAAAAFLAACGRMAGEDATEAAVKDAGARLRRPGCAAVLASYADGSGRSLSRNLDALNVAASTYVRWLVFEPAPENAARCANRDVVLFTEPGSRVVYACGGRLSDVAARDRGLASALVVHEMLHSLGLGENPPSSAQITARVLAKCR